MKTSILSLAIRMLAAIVIVAAYVTARAQTPVTGWGLEGDNQGGTTLTDNGGGNFTINVNVTGNMEARANLPVPISLINVGDTIMVSGTFTFTNGSLNNQAFRMALLNTNGMNAGTLSGGVWSTTTETNWLGYIIDFGAGGQADVAGRSGGTSKAWDSTSGDYYNLGGYNTKQSGAVSLPSEPNVVAGTYYFSMSVQLVSPNFVTVSYSLTNGSFSDIYTITNVGTLFDDGNLSAGLGLGRAQTVSTTTFNALGFFQNPGVGSGSAPFYYSNVVVSYFNNPNTGYTNVVIDNFDPAGMGPNRYDAGKIIRVWTNWFGGAWVTNTWNSTDDANGNPASGSLEILANWANGSQFVVWNQANGGINPPIPGLNMQEFSCDVQFDPSSATTTNNGIGIFGHLQVGMEDSSGNFQIFSNNYSTAGSGITGVDVRSSSNGWFHINFPINAFAFPYETSISNIAFKIDGNWYTPNLTTGTTTLRVDNVKFLELNSVVGVPINNPPPTIAISPATSGLRVFGEVNARFAREEIATVNQSESWYNGSFPVSYSFTLTNMPAITAGMQVQIWLIPLNSIPSTDTTAPYNDTSVDSTATNAFALVINNTLTGTNNNYGATVLYKTNAPGVSLNPGAAIPVVNLATNFSATVFSAASGNGTWTLTFTDNTHGSVTGPGLSPVFFTMAAGDAALFASPLVAYFGIQPNGTLAVGNSVDFLKIAIANGSGNINDDFTQDSSLNPVWNVVGTANVGGVWLAPQGSAYWINWTTPANGFDVEVNSSLTDTDNWINPASYVGYEPGPLTETLEATKIWTLISTDELPPGATNAFFRLHKPANY
jgi:hypothetical protein